MRWRNVRTKTYRIEYSMQSEKYGREYFDKRMKSTRRPPESWDDVWVSGQRGWKAHRLKQYKEPYAKPPQEPISPCLPFDTLMYIGKTSEWHQLGEEYLAIESGFHWLKHVGFVIWVTNEHYHTTDTDFCTEFTVKEFKKNFIIC